MKSPWLAVTVALGVVVALSVLGRDGRPASESVDVLARSPERLQAALRACRDLVVSADDPACRTASEAWRRHFFGEPAAPSHLVEQSPLNDQGAVDPLPLLQFAP